MEIRHYLASNSNRFFAFFIDIVMICLIVFIIFLLFFDFDQTAKEYFDRGSNVGPRIKFLKERNLIRDISVLVWIVYCVFMESSEKQGTIGKSIMGIKVVDENGNRMKFSKSLQRNLSKILSYAIVSLGFIWILFDKNKQGWHDKMNNTFVVNKDFEPDQLI